MIALIWRWILLDARFLSLWMFALSDIVSLFPLPLEITPLQDRRWPIRTMNNYRSRRRHNPYVCLLVFVIVVIVLKFTRVKTRDSRRLTAWRPPMARPFPTRMPCSRLVSLMTWNHGLKCVFEDAVVQCWCRTWCIWMRWLISIGRESRRESYTLRELVRRLEDLGVELIRWIVPPFILILITGAHGYFEVTHDISKYCKADMFSKVSRGDGDQRSMKNGN